MIAAVTANLRLAAVLSSQDCDQGHARRGLPSGAMIWSIAEQLLWQVLNTLRKAAGCGVQQPSCRWPKYCHGPLSYLCVVPVFFVVHDACSCELGVGNYCQSALYLALRVAFAFWLSAMPIDIRQQKHKCPMMCGCGRTHRGALRLMGS